MLSFVIAVTTFDNNFYVLEDNSPQYNIFNSATIVFGFGPVPIDLLGHVQSGIWYMNWSKTKISLIQRRNFLTNCIVVCKINILDGNIEALFFDIETK